MLDFPGSKYNIDLIKADELNVDSRSVTLNPREVQEVEWLAEDSACLSHTYLYPPTSGVPFLYRKPARIVTVIQEISNV